MSSFARQVCARERCQSLRRCISRAGALHLATLLLVTCAAAAGRGPEMRVRPGFGFDGVCKEFTWAPVALDLENRGAQFTGEVSISVFNADWRTRTTYHRPVVLGSRARQRVFVYASLSARSSPLRATLRAGKRFDLTREASLRVIPAFDSLIVVVGREPGTLSFLSGTPRAPSAQPPGVFSQAPPASPPYRPTLHVADSTPDLLPHAPYGYSAADLLVMGEVSAQAFRPETREALRRWVLSGGTVVVMGGPDWARLKDPFYETILPVRVDSAVALDKLPALSHAHGGGVPGSTVITHAAPKPWATVLLKQGDLPLIVEGPVGSGRVIFLAFDATRPPLREWRGQRSLWNHLLGRAESATPVIRAAFNAPGMYGGGMYAGPPGRVVYSPYYSPYSATLAEPQLAQAVLNIPAMQTPPFWLVALFLGGYAVLLIPVNYSLLKRRRRRELAWLTTPAIVVLFTFLAYLTGYGMKGGRALANQVSLVETRTGSRWAGVVSVAGLFSPAKTSYNIAASDAAAAICEVDLSRLGQRSRDLSVLQADRMSLPGVAMDMWSMRVFKMQSLARLGRGFVGDVVVAGGLAKGRVTNRTGFDLTDCQVHFGGSRQWLGRLPSGGSAAICLNVGAGQPSFLAPGAWPSSPPYSAPPYTSGSTGEIRQAVERIFMAAGQSLARSGHPILMGWTDRRFVSLTVRGRVPRTTNLTLVIVHLPVRVGAAKGLVPVPYGACKSQVVQEVGVVPHRHGHGAGINVGKGYVVMEFRLPPLPGRVTAVQRLDVFSDYGLPQHRHPSPIWGPVSGPSVASPSMPPASDMSVHLYNWRTRKWDAMCYTAGVVMVRKPGAYVRLPQGVVRAKFAHDPVTAGDTGTLHQLDISLIVRVR